VRFIIGLMTEVLLPRFREVNFVFPGEVPLHIEGHPIAHPQDSRLSLLTQPREWTPESEYVCIASGIADMETFNAMLEARIRHIEPEVMAYGFTEDIFLRMPNSNRVTPVYRGSGLLYVISKNKKDLTRRALGY